MKRRKFLKLAGGTLVLVGTGLGGISLLKKPEQIPIVYTLKGKELWEKAIDKKGIFVDKKLCLQYQLLREWKKATEIAGDKGKSLERKILEQMNNEYKIFKENPLPENFNQGTFMKYALSFNKEAKFLDTKRVAKIFDLDLNHPIYKQIKQNMPKNDNDLARKLINCALLITQKHLDHTKPHLETDYESFYKNLKNGVGDCTEYSLATANNYYTLCAYLGRLDLAEKIKISSGMVVNTKEKKTTLHGWIDYFYNNKWNFLETKDTDFIKKLDKINSNNSVLYEVEDMGGCYMVPLTYSVLKADRKTGKASLNHFIHILPVKN